MMMVRKQVGRVVLLLIICRQREIERTVAAMAARARRRRKGRAAHLDSNQPRLSCFPFLP